MLAGDVYLQLDHDATPEKEGRTPEFLMRCLLGARDEAGIPSNEGGFDEDVNVYIVGLLQGFLSPQFHQDAARFLFASDLDLAREVQSARDDRFTFRAYKTNADHLLLGIGLFRHVEGASNDSHPHLSRESEEFVGRGETYYALASSSLRRLSRRITGPELAMRKLGVRFAVYAELLQRVRMSYFHLTARLSEGTVYRLMQGAGVDPAEAGRDRDSQLADLYDSFLDAYSQWKSHPTAAHHRELCEAVRRLRRADANFAFQLPDPPDAEPDAPPDE